MFHESVLLIFTLFVGAAFEAMANTLQNPLRNEPQLRPTHLTIRGLFLGGECCPPAAKFSRKGEQACVCVQAQACVRPSVSAINMHESTWVNWGRKQSVLPTISQLLRSCDSWIFSNLSVTIHLYFHLMFCKCICFFCLKTFWGSVLIKQLSANDRVCSLKETFCSVQTVLVLFPQLLALFY